MYMTIQTTPKPFFISNRCTNWFIHSLVLTYGHINIYKSRNYIFYQQAYFGQNYENHIFHMNLFQPQYINTTKGHKAGICRGYILFVYNCV